MASGNKFYAYFVPRTGKSGVADSWGKCEKIVKGEEGARFKGFKTKDEAEKLRHLFEQLQDMILQNSFEAADFFENIRSGAAKGFLSLASEEMEAAGKALNSFDYEGALGPLRSALEKLDPGKT